jgi:hypothetical protein
MHLFGGGLMRPSPDGPSNYVRWLDAPLCELCGYAAYFLNGPADERRIAGSFGAVWVGPANLLALLDQLQDLGSPRL